MLEARAHLILYPVDKGFLAERARKYVEAIYDKIEGLPRVVGFVGGPVFGSARSTINLPQRVVYKRHKRKLALKYQTLKDLDGPILYVTGPIEGLRHGWTFCVQSGLQESLPKFVEIGGTMEHIYEYSCYSSRSFLKVPFQGANLNEAQKAFYKAIS